MAKKGVEYFPSGMARMTTRAGVRERLSGLSSITASYHGGNITIKNLQKKLKVIESAALSGLRESGALIYTEMDSKQPVIPVDTGALRAAYKIVTNPDEFPSKNKMRVLLGWPDTQIVKRDPNTGMNVIYEQYAAFVHEMTSPPYGKVNWSRPNSGPKFFESALKRNRQNIVDTIKKHLIPVI